MLGRLQHALQGPGHLQEERNRGTIVSWLISGQCIYIRVSVEARMSRGKTCTGSGESRTQNWRSIRGSRACRRCEWMCEWMYLCIGLTASSISKSILTVLKVFEFWTFEFLEHFLESLPVACQISFWPVQELRLFPKVAKTSKS